MSEPSPPRILPPHLFALGVIAIAAIGWGAGGLLLPGPWRYGGVVPMLLGVLIAVRGSRQFAAADTNIIPLTRSTALVTDGVFAFSRNPMYLGMLLFLAGAALIANTPWAWMVPAVFFVIIRQAFVVREEALMEATFGDAYNAYRSEVRRWL